MVGIIGKTVKWCEHFSGEAAILLLIPLVVFFLFLVVIVRLIASARDNA